MKKIKKKTCQTILNIIPWDTGQKIERCALDVNTKVKKKNWNFQRFTILQVYNIGLQYYRFII